MLNIKTISSGARGYLAFHKSLNIEPILDSVSTHTRSGIGGMNGRTLNRNDVLKFKDKTINHDIIGNTFNINQLEDANIIPIMEGLQFDEFTSEAHDQLVNQSYTISEMSDRMGYRLKGMNHLNKSITQILFLNRLHQVVYKFLLMVNRLYCLMIVRR